jgi:protein-L-isoaspartate(D-aspartate) O-methyltransferase
MNQRLLEFFHTLDRSYFIDNEMKSLAGVDSALPIGYGQTISQPSLVLYMTETLELDKTCKILEIGTGSGYQSAFLAEFGSSVYTVERIEPLSHAAEDRLQNLGYSNIQYKIGDGSLGWKEHAPYNRIIITAAPNRMPEEIVDQLAPEGIMLLPVGPSGHQYLKKLTKDHAGIIREEILLPVAFVELVGKYCH